MPKPIRVDEIQGGEVQETCDGCVQLHRASQLVPVGDGSIKVCGACYVKATAMVLTSGDIRCSPKSEMNSMLPWPARKAVDKKDRAEALSWA